MFNHVGRGYAANVIAATAMICYEKGKGAKISGNHFVDEVEWRCK